MTCNTTAHKLEASSLSLLFYPICPTVAGHIKFQNAHVQQQIPNLGEPLHAYFVSLIYLI